MINLVLAALAVGGAYLVFSKPGAASGTSAQTQAQLAQQNASYQAAQAFDVAANAAGLTQAQANAAWAAGQTPAQWLAATGQTAGVDPAATPAATTPTASGPMLLDYGESHTTGAPIYRCASTGRPVMQDSFGQPVYIG